MKSVQGIYDHRWVLMIGGLLASTVIANGLLTYAAVSHGGAEPIPHAYDRDERVDPSKVGPSGAVSTGSMPSTGSPTGASTGSPTGASTGSPTGASTGSPTGASTGAAAASGPPPADAPSR